MVALASYKHSCKRKYEEGLNLAREDLAAATSQNSKLWQTCQSFNIYSPIFRFLLLKVISLNSLYRFTLLLLMAMAGKTRRLTETISYYRGLVVGLGSIEAFRTYTRALPRSNSDSAQGISLILCTRNRAAFLRTCLASILATEYPELDLLVVDQSDNNHSELVFQEFSTDSRVRYLKLESKGRSRAFNAAYPLARYSIIGIFDDDCRPEKDWLNNIAAIFRNRPEVGMLVGQVLPSDYNPQLGHIPYFLLPHARYCGIQRLLEPGGAGMGANMIARREVFEASGLFDEQIGPGTPIPASDDFDLVFRAVRTGFLVFQSPASTIWHDGFRAGEDLSKLIDGYQLSGSAVCMKYVRAGELKGLLLLLGLLWNSVSYLTLRLLKRQQPLGLRALKANLKGVWVGLKMPLDLKNRVFIEKPL
ncbi:MAG: glycosyltransferase family 2 protein [Chloroflexi bacterium]|uniref:Glycosyltransferase family 2 protein n=1 Tax=Candidatus Chlorohelix allophototropha TaxID=3003348 RepID=A0A8T7M3R2_9CHLR|nr:glycosyltransferase family 2 protein [Chloroflexota bacterium]WJW66085.1 glycosyltransferase family 2 protein [Chloroflexota bacterium L227-S17]